MERAVERGMQAKERRIIKRIGVDEKAVATRHRYVTLVSDLDRGTVEYIADDRKIASLDGFWESLSVRQKAGIEAVAMDMWEPFITSTHKYLPRAEAKIVFDRFHIMQHMTRAVDEVRKAEHRQLHAEGDDTLLRTKYLWLFSEENLPEKYVERFALLRAMELKTGRAWSIKESLRILWQYRTRVLQIPAPRGVTEPGAAEASRVVSRLAFVGILPEFWSQSVLLRRLSRHTRVASPASLRSV
jgi:transposase